jgi:hypothetical protein
LIGDPSRRRWRTSLDPDRRPASPDRALCPPSPWPSTAAAVRPSFPSLLLAQRLPSPRSLSPPGRKTLPLQRMAVKPAPESTADRHPGAAGDLLRRLPTCPNPDPTTPTAVVPAAVEPDQPAATPTGSSGSSDDASPTTTHAASSAADDWAAICQTASRPAVVDPGPSPDPLLERGIGDYTVVPGVPLLGKGKFSVVYRATKAGQEVRRSADALEGGRSGREQNCSLAGGRTPTPRREGAALPTSGATQRSTRAGVGFDGC